LSYSGSLIRRIAVGVFILFFATALVFAAAQDTSRWKRYRNNEYRFEIAYPPDWLFDNGYQDNYGKPPSPGQRPAYAGETRNLFGLEMDGPEPCASSRVHSHVHLVLENDNNAAHCLSSEPRKPPRLTMPSGMTTTRGVAKPAWLWLRKSRQGDQDAVFCHLDGY
jgi:hypothetical protein